MKFFKNPALFVAYILLLYIILFTSGCTSKYDGLDLSLYELISKLFPALKMK